MEQRKIDNIEDTLHGQETQLKDMFEPESNNYCDRSCKHKATLMKSSTDYPCNQCLHSCFAKTSNEE